MSTTETISPLIEFTNSLSFAVTNQYGIVAIFPSQEQCFEYIATFCPTGEFNVKLLKVSTRLYYEEEPF